VAWLKKKSIVWELGEEELLLPEFVNFALTANDRIKYYLTLLQTAKEKAEHPQLKFPSLRPREKMSEKKTQILIELFRKPLKKSKTLTLFLLPKKFSPMYGVAWTKC
jgi:hypothetical protein